MKHEMKLNDEPFKEIKKKVKTKEIRLYDVKRRAVKTGDTITFTNTLSKEKIDVKVLGVNVYKTFKELFTKEGLDNYEKMYEYYTKEEEAKYGVCAILLEL